MMMIAASPTNRHKWEQMLPHGVDYLVLGQVSESESPFSLAFSQIGQICHLCQIRPLHVLADLEPNELLHLLLAVDTLA
jgi:hypothetical protein